MRIGIILKKGQQRSAVAPGRGAWSISPSALEGQDVDFALGRQLGSAIALAGNEEASLIAWADNLRHLHSPSGLQCEIKGEPGWEVYGRNHGGRMRISINQDALVLIYS